MNNLDGHLIPALAHMEFGRFKDRKGDEPDEEHDQSNSTHCNDEIPPSHIIGSGAGDGVGCACEGTEQRPCDEGSEELSESPEDREDSEEISVRSGQKFEKNGRICSF